MGSSARQGWRALFCCLVSLVGCGTARASLPSHLETLVRRTEEQHLDYSSSGSFRFELTLNTDGTGQAISTASGTEVADGDVRHIDESIVYDARAAWEGAVLGVELTQLEPATDNHASVLLHCERWTASMRAPDAEDPTLPGVDWVCALPDDRMFGLGLVVIQHIPRMGGFLLFGEGRAVVVDEVLRDQSRELSTTP